MWQHAAMAAFSSPYSPRRAPIAWRSILCLSLIVPGVQRPAIAQDRGGGGLVQPTAGAACQEAGPATRLHATHPDTPRHARAVWLDDRHLRWPAVAAGQPSSGHRFVLYASDRAALRIRPGHPVEGAGDTLRLQPTNTPLPAGVVTRTRHVGDGITLRVAASATRERLAALHQQQLLLVREDQAGRVLDATGTQLALALDALYGAAAEATGFGAEPGAASTRFTVWAPTARAVGVCVQPHDTATARWWPLERDARSGAWSGTVAGATHGARYRYDVDVPVPGVGIVRQRVTDPWSLALTANSAHSVVADLRHPSVVPDGWMARRILPAVPATDQVIYELHVRDFSVRDERVPTAHRGRYLAFTDSLSHGMQHLRALARAGLTDVHLLPVFDIATIPEVDCRTPDVHGLPNAETQQAIVTAAAAGDCFNWGYDPFHFTVPEGSYATDVHDVWARIREFRRMVLALNAAGLRVGMDVVYNHTSASGQAPTSVLDRLVPGYYHRLDADGQVETSTCCANTATEHRIMAKLMIESAVTWVSQYGIGAFRFDLMGHQPRTVMERLQQAVNAAAGRHVSLIGEGWNFGEVANGRRFVQASQRSLTGSGIGTFSDRARDAIRGGSALDDGIAQVRQQGWVNGLGYAPNAERQRTATVADDRRALLAAADLVRVGLAGSLSTYRMTTADGRPRPLAELPYGDQPAGYAAQPGEVVNYVENHDNQTLFDALVLKLPHGTSLDDRVRVQSLASALVLFSQGIAYVHAGQELLRSKSLDRNSFDSGDWFNSYDPTGVWHGFGRGLPPARDNAASWPFMRERLADTALRPTPAHVQRARAMFLDLLRIRRSSTLFRLRTAAEVDARLRFANVGPSQIPTVVVGHLDGRGHPGAGFADLLYAVNTDTVAHDVAVPELTGAGLTLHPVQAAPDAADPRARSSRWDAGRGVLTVPPRTAVVWVGTERREPARLY